MKRWIRITLQALVLLAAVYILAGRKLTFIEPRWEYTGYAIVGFVAFVTAARLVFNLIEIYYRSRSTDIDPGKDNFILGLTNIYYIVFSLALLLLVLRLFGIDYRTLFTSLSIVAAAIAIVTRDFMADMLSGIFLSFSQNMRIDDYVKIGEVKGKILDMGLQKITFLNDDDDIIFIPNFKVYQSEIINYTKGNQRRMSVEFQIPIEVVDDVDVLEIHMVDHLADFAEYIEPGSYSLKIVNLTKDYLDLKFLYTLRELDRDVYRDIRRRTSRRALNFVRTRSKVAREGREQGGGFSPNP